MNAPALRSTALPALVTRLAGHFDMVDVNPAELIETLKATAFKTSNGAPTDAQMTALLVVANQYRLNPWTKEIYAYPAKGGGIVPIVGVDGWANIINSHPQFDGMEFEYDHGEGGPKGSPVSVTCVIYRKDRTRPTKVTEFFDECYRNTEPWNGMKRRMLRHKAMIQCGRLAFGYGGIHDPEEGEVIAGEKFMGPADVVQPAGAATAPAAASTTAPADTDEAFDRRLPIYRGYLAAGKSHDDIVSFIRSKRVLTPEQETRIRSLKAEAAEATEAGAGQQVTDVQAKDAPASDGAPQVTYAQVADRITRAQNADQLGDAEDLIGAIDDPQQRSEAVALAAGRRTEITKEG